MIHMRDAKVSLASTVEGDPKPGEAQAVAAALESLARYDVLDTPREEAFDRVTRLVRHIFDVPIATVTFLDGHRQWFKSCLGLDVGETARDIAFCKIPVAENRMLVIPDTHDDPRFRENPLVVGSPHLRFYAGAPLHDGEGRCIGTLCAMDTKPRLLRERELELLVDLAHVVESELELRLLATTDGLTGTSTRRAFIEAGERAVQLAVRHRHPLSCIALDLDRFKSINDSLGHAAGDAVLAATAKTCASLLRSSDVFGRLGGEEFSILLPYAGASEAAKVAEKLRAGVEAQAGSANGRLAPVTASFGVAALSAAAADLTSLLAEADAALYLAKTQGRNRCVVSAARAQNAPVGRKVLKAGRIMFNFGGSTIDCTVKRLSETGATLEVVSTADVPKTFKLQVESDALSKMCRVAGKNSRQIEVLFD